ncbi:MAG TPA: hypothetical protein PK775_02080 [Rectinema sp.]|jgi:DNA polymerase-3 subunit gamma/tau|nr:hypothetical protein [Rectinema sp.]HNY98547.1 hypothetical protein [Rectinema sp.]HOH05104.1 hypothetical protein [Rectinema sp.]HQL16060.1 hypothetical protein [Rectinema sp.]
MTMFENLLFQNHALEQLVSLAKEKKVPPALLFVGPAGSGKLTAALECARVLSCEKEGEWNCQCIQCNCHRNLMHPDLLLFGPREFPQETIVTGEYLIRKPNLTSYYAFARSIRKLLKRFDSVLWQGEEARLSKAIQSIETCEEMLQEILEQVLKKKNHGLSALVDSAVNAAAGLESLVPDGIPIFMIRNMISWAVLAPSAKTKMIIIQNADAANESSRNAMLKILEEPPETARFILTSSSRATIIATILSRSRLISFDPRTDYQAREIISRLFHANEDIQEINSISEFFQNKSAYPPKIAIQDAALFVGALLGKAMEKDAGLSGERALELASMAQGQNVSTLSMLRQVSEKTNGFGAKNSKFTNSFLVFIRGVAQHLTSIATDPSSSASLTMYVDRLFSKLREMNMQYRTLNRSPELLLEAFADIFGEQYESHI